MNKINTVVFDLGGVLIDWNPDYVYRNVFATEDEMKWFYQNICTPDWNEQQDAGRSLQEGTEWLVNKFPEQESNIRIYYDRWEEMLGGPIQQSVEILNALQSHPDLRLFALTNWSAETFPIALRKYPFLHSFHGRIVSGEEKTRKPFKDIYQRLIERFDIEPQRSIYVDDNLRNLSPAKELGFAVIHFQSPLQLKNELGKYEII